MSAAALGLPMDRGALMPARGRIGIALASCLVGSACVPASTTTGGPRTAGWNGITSAVEIGTAPNTWPAGDRLCAWIKGGPWPWHHEVCGTLNVSHPRPGTRLISIPLEVSAGDPASPPKHLRGELSLDAEGAISGDVAVLDSSNAVPLPDVTAASYVLSLFFVVPPQRGRVEVGRPFRLALPEKMSSMPLAQAACVAADSRELRARPVLDARCATGDWRGVYSFDVETGRVVAVSMTAPPARAGWAPLEFRAVLR
jgi:hypothetical protein